MWSACETRGCHDVPTLTSMVALFWSLCSESEFALRGLSQAYRGLAHNLYKAYQKRDLALSCQCRVREQEMQQVADSVDTGYSIQAYMIQHTYCTLCTHALRVTRLSANAEQRVTGGSNRRGGGLKDTTKVHSIL